MRTSVRRDVVDGRMARFEDPLARRVWARVTPLKADFDVPAGVFEGGGARVVPGRFLAGTGLDAGDRHGAPRYPIQG